MGLFDLIYPKRCLECGEPGRYLCTVCLAKAGKARTHCPVCGRYAFLGVVHPSCRKVGGIEGIYPLWAYKGVIRKSVLALKYRFVADLAKELSAAFISEYGRRPVNIERGILIPVPLHTKRARWRGFNQAEELGKRIAEGLGWEYETKVLCRKKHTKPQAQLTKKERGENVKGVFTADSRQIKRGATYVVFDDVLTTGSTIIESAKNLQKANAGCVWGLTIAG